MKILAENNINITSRNTILDIIKEKKKLISSPISLFPKISEKKRLLAEAKALAAEAEKESKIAYLLLSDFKIEKENVNMYKNKSANIQNFAKYEYYSAKKILDETGTLIKNEKKRKKENNNTYIRIKKKKFAGGIEINDYTNGELTRKILKIGNNITVTAIDINGETSIYSFDTEGNLLSYLEGIASTEHELKAKEKLTFSNGNLSEVSLEYEKYSDGSEASKKRYILVNNNLREVFRSYKKYINQETEISSSEFFEFSRKDTPQRYCRNYSLSTSEEENCDLEFKYETIDHLTYLKESRKTATQNSEEEKRYISRFKKRNLRAIYIQDIQTKFLRYYTFDIEGNPTNYYEDTLDN